MKYLLAVIFLAFGKLWFVPTTYYITPSGSGSGTGLDSNNTMSYTALYPKTLATGDIVKFKAGNTYSGQHYAKDGVTYDRYSSGANPIISGFTTMTGWTNSSGNIWYVPLVNSKVQCVQIDGTSRGVGRYPNTGYLTYTSHTDNTSISGATVSALPASFVGGEVVIKKWRYILDRHKITAQSGGTITYSSTNFYGNSSSYEPTDGNGYFVQNHLATLDQDGEWYSDGTGLYVYSATNPTGRTIKVSTVDQLVPLNSTVNVTFNNIDFEGGNIGVQNNATNNIVFNNCNFRFQGTAIYGVDCNGLTMTGGSISDCGSNGFNVDGAGNNTTVSGVTIRRTGIIPGMGESGDGRYTSINVGGNNTLVSNCTVIKSGFNGISFDGNDILVEKNLVDSSNLVKDDGAGIYSFTPDGVTRSNRIIRDNIVLHSIGNYDGGAHNGQLYGQAAAIYLDGFSNHVTVRNNSCAYGSWMGIFENGNSFNTITGNTTFDFLYGIALNQTATSGFGAIRNLLMTGNTCIARTTSQVAMLVAILFVNDNPSSFGTIDNNLYARPVDDNQTIRVDRESYSGATGITNISLASWKSTSGLDAASTKSLVTTSDPNNLRYDYNYSSASSFPGLPAVYKDVRANTYNGMLSLSPYSGNVLIYNSALPIPSTGGSLIIRGRKVDVISVP